MKKKLTLAAIAFVAAFAAGCSTFAPSHDLVYDIQSIEPKTINLNQVQIPMKDFSVVGPVLAQTSISLSEFLSSEYNSSAYDKDGFSSRFKKAKGEHRVMMEGSYLIQRLLLEEAYRKGADAIVNISIEYENSCHKVGVSDNDDYSVSYSQKVVDFDLTGGVSYARERNVADVNGRRVVDDTNQSSSSVLGLNLFTRDSTTAKSVSYSFSEEQNDCNLIIYGSALSIKYTEAIVPKCDNCR